MSSAVLPRGQRGVMQPLPPAVKIRALGTKSLLLHNHLWNIRRAQ